MACAKKAEGRSDQSHASVPALRSEMFGPTSADNSLNLSPADLLVTTFQRLLNAQNTTVRMADDVAFYFHATLYHFVPEARKEVIRRFNATVQDVSAQCWYDTCLDVSHISAPR